MRENVNQQNSEYGHFSRSNNEQLIYCFCQLWKKKKKKFTVGITINNSIIYKKTIDKQVHLIFIIVPLNR